MQTQFYGLQISKCPLTKLKHSSHNPKINENRTTLTLIPYYKQTAHLGVCYLKKKQLPIQNACFAGFFYLSCTTFAVLGLWNITDLVHKPQKRRCIIIGYCNRFSDSEKAYNLITYAIS